MSDSEDDYMSDAFLGSVQILNFENCLKYVKNN